MSAHIHSMVIGRTGDGKTTLCDVIVRFLGSNDSPFEGFAGVSSHTHEPKAYTIDDVTIVDTPGLMDTGGVQQDEHNIRVIVDHSRKLGYVNAFILVLNEQSARFDDGMQAAVKLLADSFGPACFQHMAIAFTKAYGMVTLAEAQVKAKTIAEMLSERTGFVVPHLRCYQIDCNPQQLVKMGVPPNLIDDKIARRDRAIADLLRWVQAAPAMNTAQAEYGEYEERKKTREAAEAAERARHEAERERFMRSVVSTDTENRTVVVRTETTPIYEQRWVKVGEKRRGGLSGIMGNMKDINQLQNVHVGNKTTTYKREEKRHKQVLGSGQVIYGDWQIVREWPEES